jgi:hypothetical protein
MYCISSLCIDQDPTTYILRMDGHIYTPRKHLDELGANRHKQFEIDIYHFLSTRLKAFCSYWYCTPHSSWVEVSKRPPLRYREDNFNFPVKFLEHDKEESPTTYPDEMILSQSHDSLPVKVTNSHKFENHTIDIGIFTTTTIKPTITMQRITNIIKPSILRKGKYHSKLADDESDEMPLKLSQPPGASRRGSFRLTKKDSSRSLTSQDQTLQSSISTFNSSISSISSLHHHYDDDDPLPGNESSSSLKHIEDLKPRHPRAVRDEEEPKPRRPRALQGDEKVQLRKPRRLSLGNKRSPKPQVIPSTNVPKMNPRRSRNVQAEQEVPRKIMSKSLSNKRVPKVQRSSSSRRVTDSKASVAPRKSTTTGSCSLDDFMEQYDEIMVEFPDTGIQKDVEYVGSKSVTGW